MPRTELFTVEYGFSAGLTGLCYIGLGLGCVIATIYGGSFANKIYLRARTILSSPELPLSPNGHVAL